MTHQLRRRSPHAPKRRRSSFARFGNASNKPERFVFRRSCSKRAPRMPSNARGRKPRAAQGGMRDGAPARGAQCSAQGENALRARRSALRMGARSSPVEHDPRSRELLCSQRVLFCMRASPRAFDIGAARMPHAVPRYSTVGTSPVSRIWSSCSSSSTGTPSATALSYFDPADSPATT